jgi:hypothetical protein
MTRISATNQRILRDTLKDQCTEFVKQAKNPENLKDLGWCVSTYLKLVENRRRLTKLVEELVPISPTPAGDLSEAGELDRQCLIACENLYQVIPEGHALKKTQLPLHIAHVMAAHRGDGGGDQEVVAASSRPTMSCKEPRLEEFDGRKSSWMAWKSVFEREVHGNEQLASERKFDFLLANLVKGSRPHRLASVYVGVRGAYELAWEDLKRCFDSACDLKSTHLLALRDLSKNCKVSEQDKFYQLERLYETAWGRINALKASGAEPAAYESLALIGLKESMPESLRMRFFREHPNADLGGGGLQAILTFLKAEVAARRSAWEMSAERTMPLKRSNDRKGEGSQRHNRSKKGGFHKHGGKHPSGKHSSMVQSQAPEQSEEEDASKNE